MNSFNTLTHMHCSHQGDPGSGGLAGLPGLPGEDGAPGQKVIPHSEPIPTVPPGISLLAHNRSKNHDVFFYKMLYIFFTKFMTIFYNIHPSL